MRIWAAHASTIAVRHLATRWRSRILPFVSLGFACTTMYCNAAADAAMPSVLTRAYDNDRSGSNLQETTLTQAGIKAHGVRLLTTIPVFGDKRGVEAQPLILPQVKTSKGMRDVMVLVSMANQVRGVDARTGESIWSANLGTPINGSAAIDMHLVNDHWGVLSTGVIDPDTQRVYLVA